VAITEAFTLSAVTVGTTELSIVSGTTTLTSTDQADGVYQLFLDAGNMAKGDEFEVRVYDSALTAGTKRQLAKWSLLGLQAEAFATPSLILLHTWDFTLKKVAGTDRAFTASIRKAG
jgi:hypothetical protein